MHSKMVVHRDLKPGNILLNSSEQGVYDVRIADFGLSQTVDNGQLLKDRCGTPTYIAPEILRNIPYSFKADIFSIGSIMYNIVTRRFLFEDTNENKIIKLNHDCNILHVTKNISFLSKDGQDLLLKHK